MDNVIGSFLHLIRESGFLSLIVAVLLVVSAATAPASALGPVDGEGLKATDLERVTVGDPAPDFTLEAETGTPITLSQLRGKKTVILVFYRGHW